MSTLGKRETLNRSGLGFSCCGENAALTYAFSIPGLSVPSTRDLDRTFLQPPITFLSETNCRSREDTGRESRGATISLRQRGGRDGQRQAPEGSRHGKRDQPPHGVLLLWVLGHRAAVWTASMSPQHKAALPWALGGGPKDSARARLHGGVMPGKDAAAPDLTCPPGLLACWQGGKEWALTPRAPVEASAPGLAREALRALGFKGELHHGLPRSQLPETATPGLSRGQLGSSD